MTVVHGLASPGQTVQTEGGFSTSKVPCDQPVTYQEDGSIFSARIGMGFPINCARLWTESDEASTRTEQCVRDRGVQLRNVENHAHLLARVKCRMPCIPWTTRRRTHASEQRLPPADGGCNLMFEKAFEGVCPSRGQVQVQVCLRIHVR